MDAPDAAAAPPARMPSTRERVARTLCMVRFGNTPLPDRSRRRPALLGWLFFEAAALAEALVRDAAVGIQPPDALAIGRELYGAVAGSNPEMGDWRVRRDVHAAYERLGVLVLDWCRAEWSADSEWLLPAPPPPPAAAMRGR